MSRIAIFSAVFALVGIIGLLQADTNGGYSFVQVKHAKDHIQHDGHALVKGKLNTDGKHKLHEGKNHTAHAHAEGGKVKNVSAHDPKGNVLKTHKVKSAKKHHAANGNGTRHVYVSSDGTESDEPSDCGVVIFVGFQVIIVIVNAPQPPPPVIYWFPVTIVVGGDTGCSIYDGSFNPCE